MTDTPDTEKLSLAEIFAKHFVAPTGATGLVVNIADVMAAMVETHEALWELERRMNDLRSHVDMVMPVIMEILNILNDSQERNE